MKLGQTLFFRFTSQVTCTFFAVLLVTVVSFQKAIAQDSLANRINLIKKHVIPIHLSQPVNKLHFLEQFIRNTRMVAIGEQTHGTSEFFKWRYKI